MHCNSSRWINGPASATTIEALTPSAIALKAPGDILLDKLFGQYFLMGLQIATQRFGNNRLDIGRPTTLDHTFRL